MSYEEEKQDRKIERLDAEIERLKTREAGLEERLEWQVKNFVKERDGEVQKLTAQNRRLEAHIRAQRGVVGWEITDKRVAAIRDARIALRDCVEDSNDPHCWDEELATLEAMLEGNL